MGAYLSEPNTQKESQDDSTDQISYGASSMQGWRLEQEDAHTSLLNFDARTRSSLFAVYDGHGGSEVAKYCAKYLPEYLQSHLDEFRDGGDLKAALKHLFLALDERLKSEEAQRELKEMRDKSEKGDDADTTAIQNDEDLSQNGSDEEGAGNGKEKKSETELLYDEATMPLEQVLMRYRKCETRVKKVLEKNKPKNSSEEEKENHKHEEKKSGEVVDFQKQEEIDINEIKKNSKSDSSESNNNSNHEQDYDEASNLGDITESQQKNNKSTNDNSKSNSESKQKLNKEELKLSPITKKSSFSSNDEDAESNNKPTSTSRDNSNESSNEESTHNQEKEHKTPRASSSSSGIDVEVETSEEASVSVKKSSASSNSRNNALLAKKLQLPLRNVSHKSQNLIAKFIADCVNTKLKAANKLISNKPAAAVAAASSRRNKKKNKKAESDEKEEGKNGVKEGDEEEADEEDEEASGGDSEEEEEEDEEDEDDDEDSSEDEDEEFEDDDDDDDEEDDEEEEDEDEEDDEEEDDEEDEDYEIEKVEYDMEMQGEGVLAGQPRPGYDSGCTAVVALLVDQKHLYVANAGDSRCVVCRDGKAVDMSEDHKPEDEIERTRIERAGGTISKDGRVNNGLNLSRAIGDHSYKLNEGLPLSEQMITSMPDVKYLELDSQRDKFMVLACDGIWNFMSSQEVCDYVSERLNANYSKLSQICEELFMHCLAPNSEGDGTGCDNMTCIIVTFNPFRQASAQIPPAQAVAAGLKRSHENNNNNGKENGGGDAASNKPHDPVDVVKSESGKEAASQNNNEDEASNISKKLKQEHDGRDLGHVISERAS